MTMTTDKLEKLEDYLNGFENLDNPVLFPIGALLIEAAGRNETLDLLKKRRFSIVQSGENFSLEDSIPQLFNEIAQGEKIAVSMPKGPSPRFLNFFQGFADGRISAMLPGSNAPQTINPIPSSAKILLVLDQELYDNDEYCNKVISSVCRLL